MGRGLSPRFIILLTVVTCMLGMNGSLYGGQTKVAIVRLNPRLDAIVPPGSSLEKIADGFEWTEGPVWDRAGSRLLFSDVPRNAIFQWKPREGARLFLERSGYTGNKKFTGREPGSNGLAFDAQGRLHLCQHGDRRVSRLESDGSRTVVADSHAGKRLNSPNDLVFKSDGDLYFTDPPFGLPKVFDDPAKETPYSGVYRVAKDGKITALNSVSKIEGPEMRLITRVRIANAILDPASMALMAIDRRKSGSVMYRSFDISGMKNVSDRRYGAIGVFMGIRFPSTRELGVSSQKFMES